MLEYVHEGWLYFKIRKGVYGLPQFGMLATKILETRLNAAGYYQASTTPVLWCHKWIPILFVLIVENFGTEYSGKRHIHHLRKNLQSHYTITKYWEGTRFSGIDFEWDYNKLTFHLSMNRYVLDILDRYHHTPSNIPQLSPHKYTVIYDVLLVQYATEANYIPPIDSLVIKQFQVIIGALL